mgnify:CR=1 FL=1
MWRMSPMIFRMMILMMVMYNFPHLTGAVSLSKSASAAADLTALILI